ncbi:uncharacterized protein AMSG_01146 [Thecamonas trahens ATCC 50062]|uniref:Uncharacterized protein n=1 Tax=Thecamonas trahens ATCC 50062 TaxID=461836 RepID=A0A0L0DIU6_THETB|nr:hypothetical protein AMSG_01146 [Thecamonas trahens ATCC 50062]KNC52314.1 hypothetical protein AMSG_01146 [Thecamonas trahens ATCC 50062]|eukprot:XP_013762311.1 hypothetical protein AMSG_01146 [Thecamonas trahens ATCC 50062]
MSASLSLALEELGCPYWESVTFDGGEAAAARPSRLRALAWLVSVCDARALPRDRLGAVSRDELLLPLRILGLGGVLKARARVLDLPEAAADHASLVGMLVEERLPKSIDLFGWQWLVKLAKVEIDNEIAAANAVVAADDADVVDGRGWDAAYVRTPGSEAAGLLANERKQLAARTDDFGAALLRQIAADAQSIFDPETGLQAVMREAGIEPVSLPPPARKPGHVVPVDLERVEALRAAAQLETVAANEAASKAAARAHAAAVAEAKAIAGAQDRNENEVTAAVQPHEALADVLTRLSAKIDAVVAIRDSAYKPWLTPGALTPPTPSPLSSAVVELGPAFDRLGQYLSDVHAITSSAHALPARLDAALGELETDPLLAPATTAPLVERTRILRRPHAS